MGVFKLQVLHQLLLLLEDVLELSKSGLHLLQRELVLTLRGLVLCHPGVELSDGVVKQCPFLQEDINLLHPLIRDSLDLVVPLLQSSNLSISLSMSGHLLGSSVCSIKNLSVGKAGLVEGRNLLMKGLDLVQICRLGKTLSSGLLSTSQPGRVLLDSSPVLSPELDIVGVLVALNLGVCSQLGNIVCDPLQLILEGLGVGIHFVSLGKKSKLGGSSFSKNRTLGGNILLEVHGPGYTILREHGAGSLLDVLKLSSGSILPAINGLKAVVEGSKISNKLFNDSNGFLEASNNLKLDLNSCNLLANQLLLVLRKGDGHAGEVIIDSLEEATDGVVALIEQVLPLLHVRNGIIKSIPLLHLLDLLLSNLKLCSNGLIVLSITDPGLLGVHKELQSIRGLLLGIIPTLLNPLDITLKELGFVRVLKDDLALSNEVHNNIPLAIKLNQGLLLPLNELIHILDTGWGDVTGGGKHDTVQELNMGLQLITVGVALPVEIHHDLSLHDSGNELLMLLDQTIKETHLLGTLVFGSFCHQDFKNLGEPFFDLSPLQIFAESMEVVSLPLELGRGVNLVRHDTS